MWSNLYWYYEIRADANYTHHLPTATVIQVLKGTGRLKETGAQTFVNTDQYPWMNIVAVNSDNGNYGRPEQFNSETINLIAIVASRQYPANETFYLTFFASLAEQLNWELILESDDNGNEDVLLRAIR